MKIRYNSISNIPSQINGQKMDTSIPLKILKEQNTFGVKNKIKGLENNEHNKICVKMEIISDLEWICKFIEKGIANSTDIYLVSVCFGDIEKGRFIIKSKKSLHNSHKSEVEAKIKDIKKLIKESSNQTNHNKILISIYRFDNDGFKFILSAINHIDKITK